MSYRASFFGSLVVASALFAALACSQSGGEPTLSNDAGVPPGDAGDAASSSDASTTGDASGDVGTISNTCPATTGQFVQGTSLTVSAGPGSVSTFPSTFSASGANLLMALRDPATGDTPFFEVPVSGGAATKVTTLPGVAYRTMANSGTVTFFARDDAADGVNGLYRVPAAGPSFAFKVGIKLHTHADVQISGNTVYYSAVDSVAGKFTIFRAPIDGSGPETTVFSRTILTGLSANADTSNFVLTGNQIVISAREDDASADKSNVLLLMSQDLTGGSAARKISGLDCTELLATAGPWVYCNSLPRNQASPELVAVNLADLEVRIVTSVDGVRRAPALRPDDTFVLRTTERGRLIAADELNTYFIGRNSSDKTSAIYKHPHAGTLDDVRLIGCHASVDVEHLVVAGNSIFVANSGADPTLQGGVYKYPK